MEHITVLKDAAVAALNIRAGGTIVDATLGSLGHAKEILSRMREGLFVGIDADRGVIERAKQELRNETGTTIHLATGNFRTLDSILSELRIESVDGILADLGWRMEQFSGNGKGFSFRVDEPLLMTFKDVEEGDVTATDIVNDWGEEDIANVLFGYGEERYSRRIAGALVRAREKEPIKTSGQLAALVEASVPASYRHGKIHAATRTFQALRIAVNDELGALRGLLESGVQLLKSEGRMAIITFHSIEDRIVKEYFRDHTHDQAFARITKKPMRATAQEIQDNPRSRSAKLRVIEKL